VKFQLFQFTNGTSVVPFPSFVVAGQPGFFSFVGKLA
jgi:hypothetical protein